VIKLISFIVITQFFHFNELKMLRQPGYLIFKVKPTIFFYIVYIYILLTVKVFIFVVFLRTKVFSSFDKLKIEPL